MIKVVRLNSRVGIEISVVDGFNQLLGYLDDLLFTGYTDDGRERGRQMVNGEEPVRGPDNNSLCGGVA